MRFNLRRKISFSLQLEKCLGGNRRLFSVGRLVVRVGRPWSIPGLSIEMFQRERNFSTAGIVVDRLRSWLSPAHVDMMVYVCANITAISTVMALINEGVDK
jgi:hypothetical protein